MGEEAGDKAASVLLKTVSPVEALLPAGATLIDVYEPGTGPAIGVVDIVQGKTTLIYRSSTNRAYKGKKGLALYAGDTLITGEKGRMQASLNDKSSLVVSPYSKLEINESVYDPDGDSRRSRLSLLFGKAKFLVSKLIGGRERDYVVNTPTAVLGVRGTEFAVAVVPQSEFTAQGAPESRILAWIRDMVSVSEAFAQNNGLVTTALTGPESSLYFGGTSGSEVSLEENSVSYVSTGFQASAPMAVTPALITSIMTSLGPGVAVMGMPSELD